MRALCCHARGRQALGDGISGGSRARPTPWRGCERPTRSFRGYPEAVAASPGLRDLANLGFLQLDLVRAYCALGDASSVDDAERRLAAAGRRS